MKLTINGRPAEHAVSTGAELLDVLKIEKQRVAVLVNGQIVRRAELVNHRLEEGDQVEIVTMVGGG